MITIEIDGKKVEVTQGQMIIEAADAIGIAIPRFCYHKKLSIAANCRMCLVDVANAPKAVPACATPVAEGMKVSTVSPRARDAQKAVMEFLLINHPLDCPICDQGGQCELQDVALEYGQSNSQFDERKRVVKDKNIGPLIETEMTRCIHCTRCVRFGTEIAGQRELGATSRGEAMQIGTFVEQSVNSEISGNVIDLCPVGALTSKPFRFKARAWELQARPTISPHDSLGSNMYYHVIRDTVMRTLPRENEALNEVWLSDRDRFSYNAYNHADRLQKPLIKKEGEWQTVDWHTALVFARDKLNEVIQHSPKELGVLASPSSTTEEYYLLQKLMRHHGCHNIDYRLKMVDTHASYAPAPWSMSLKDLEEQNQIVLIGSYLRKEQPLLNARVRKAAIHGAQVFTLNPYHMDFNYPVTESVNARGHFIESLAALAKAVSNQALPGHFAQIPISAQVENAVAPIAQALRQGPKKCFIVGQLAYSHPQASLIHALVEWICTQTQASLCELGFGANSLGALAAHAVPDEGMNAVAMVLQPRQGYLLLNCEPELDMALQGAALKAMKAAKTVVALSVYDSANLRDYADVILPITPNSETEGTYINAFGEWQSFESAVTPLGESRPAWKVLRVLANVWDTTGFEYQNSLEVLTDVKKHQKANTAKSNQMSSYQVTQIDGLVRLAPVSLYHIDGIVRRAQPLQETQDADYGHVKISPQQAQKMGLQAGQSVWVEDEMGRSQASLPVVIDESIPDGTAWVPMGLAVTQTLGSLTGTIRLERA